MRVRAVPRKASGEYVHSFEKVGVHDDFFLVCVFEGLGTFDGRGVGGCGDFGTAA